MHFFTVTLAENITDPAAKLCQLLDHCEGKANESIEHCLLMEPEAGYQKAIKILEKRFGDARIVCREYMSAVANGPKLEPGDVEGLSDLASRTEVSEDAVIELRMKDNLQSEVILGNVVNHLPVPIQEQRSVTVGGGARFEIPGCRGIRPQEIGSRRIIVTNIALHQPGEE